jgi:glycosyltransferase involved in cell wall biosynthesis
MEILTRKHDLDGHVIAPIAYEDSPVWESGGKLARRDFDPAATPLRVHFLPARNGDVGRYGFEWESLRRALADIEPVYVYAQAEFWEGIVQQFLIHYRFRRTPRIVAYAATNHITGATPLFSRKWPFLKRTRLLQKLLWPRLNGVCACATKSMVCARRMGLPECVPVAVNYLPVFGPEDAASEPIRIPWDKSQACIIGYAGLLSEQKGWRVLLSAIELLPDRYKAVIAGAGEQQGMIESLIAQPQFKDRVFYAGLLPKDKLLATYRLFDVFVLPAVTTPTSVEQFGCVLAEAMACGIPVIGSSSGAIPETIGDAGFVFPEGDAQSLADTVMKAINDNGTKHSRVAIGLRKYEEHYSCDAYARTLASIMGLDTVAA